MVSVTQRKEPDLTKRFNNTSIDWAVIESQLLAWGELYRAGKKLRLNLTLGFPETTRRAQGLFLSGGKTSQNVISFS